MIVDLSNRARRQRAVIVDVSSQSNSVAQLQGNDIEGDDIACLQDVLVEFILRSLRDFSGWNSGFWGAATDWSDSRRLNLGSLFGGSPRVLMQLRTDCVELSAATKTGCLSSPLAFWCTRAA